MFPSQRLEHLCSLLGHPYLGGIPAVRFSVLGRLWLWLLPACPNKTTNRKLKFVHISKCLEGKSGFRVPCTFPLTFWLSASLTVFYWLFDAFKITSCSQQESPDNLALPLQETEVPQNPAKGQIQVSLILKCQHWITTMIYLSISGYFDSLIRISQTVCYLSISIFPSFFILEFLYVLILPFYLVNN